MSMIKFLKPDFTFKDSRGSLTQLVKRGFSQINYIKSFADTERGEHYHKFNSEAFYVINGSFSLIIIFNEIREVYEFKRGDFFIIPPYVKHSFKFLENTELISMYTYGVELDDNEMDIYTT